MTSSSRTMSPVPSPKPMRTTPWRPARPTTRCVTWRRPRVDPAFSDLPATDDASREGAAARLEVVSGRGEDRESCGEGRFDGAHGLGGLVLRAVIARNGDDLHRTDLDRSTSDPPTGRLRVGDDPVEGSPMGRGRPMRLRRSWPVTHHAVSSHPGTLWLITGHNRRIHRQPAAAGAKRELARVSGYAASPPRRSHRVELRPTGCRHHPRRR